MQEFPVRKGEFAPGTVAAARRGGAGDESLVGVGDGLHHDAHVRRLAPARAVPALFV